MSVAQQPPITAEEFAKMPDPADGSQLELVRGEVVVIARAERQRSRRHNHEIGDFWGLRLPRRGYRTRWGTFGAPPRGSSAAQVPAGTFEGSGTIRMYGFGSSHSPNSSLASSFETEPAMITSSPGCH